MGVDDNDVPKYRRGDLRRMLTVLTAIDTITDATLVKVVARTGIDKKTVTMLVNQAAEQAGVRIEKDGPVYRLLGHTKLESTVRYLGIEVDDALEMAEQTEV